MRIGGWISDVCSSDLDDLLSAVDADARRHPRGTDHLHPARPADVRGAAGRRIGVRAGDQLCRAGGAQWPCRSLPDRGGFPGWRPRGADPGRQYLLRRSEEHTSELQSLMRISYAVFCLKKNNKNIKK